MFFFLGIVGFFLLVVFVVFYIEIDIYYEGVEGKIGELLKSVLYDIISGYMMLFYSEVWNVLKEIDEDLRNLNNVILFYMNELWLKNLNGGNVGDWNCEYVWVKFYGNFGISKGSGIDIYYLCLVDV